MDFKLIVLLVFCLMGQIAGWLFAKVPKEVCYGKLGCFSKEYPYTNTRRLLPRSPEAIGTKFYLATRNVTGYKELVVTENHQKCSWQSFCEGEKRLILLIHGYLYHLGELWVDKMVNELLKNGDYNVIMVDWKKGSSEYNYHQSAANIRVVGAQVAELLKVFKNVYHIDPSNVHIIGHSLGAHAAGYAGEHLDNIGRITGLDPAGPSFEKYDPRVRLDETDATFVDVIHTDDENLLTLGFGMNQQCGTVDIYPNGGKDQPGCPNSYSAQFDLLFGGNFAVISNVACSHLRALDYFTESINSQCHFTAYPCNTSSSEQCKTCGTTGCGVMGFHTNTSLQSGKYFLKTNAEVPYCLQ